MKVIIDSMLRLTEVPPDILKQIKAELTMKNPEYAKKMRMGLNRWACGPEYIKLWSEKTIDGLTEYILPRGYYARLWEITGGSMQVSDNRLILVPVEYPEKPNLRDYQSPALELARDWEQGAVIMPCGGGKTETALGIAADLGQPTLWITHTMDLLKQSMDRAISRLGLKGDQIGVIQGENMSIGSHMTFATVQTLSKRDLSEIRNRFGCIIIDEAHMVFKDASKARMFESVISQFSAFYRFGVTASEHRSDGLISTMFHVIGPKIYEVDQNDPRIPTVKPKVEFIETDFKYEVDTYEEVNEETGEMEEKKEMLNVKQMIATMTKDEDRRKILNFLFGARITEDDVCLVLGESLEHLESMWAFIDQVQGKSATFIHGTTPKKQREKVMADMRVGKYQYLFATYALAKLGLDIPRLNKLLLSTPMKDRTSIQQAVGRVMRPAEGKPMPIVYDIYDKNVPQLRNWARERVKVYRSLGCEIIGGPKVRK